MNDRFDLHIITQFINVFPHTALFHAKPPNFPRLFDPRDSV